MAKKKTAAGLKSKKLEDRIAPGMVGGGLIDPGMVDAVDLDGSGEGEAENVEETQTEDLASGTEAGYEGQYLDDTASSSAPLESDGAEAPQDAPEEDFTSEHNDEFSQDNPNDEYADNPDSGSWQEPDWVNANADGSIDIIPPDGVTVDADSGIASFPLEVANEELPIPDDMQITESGGIEAQLPEGSQYLSESNQLILPADSVSLDEVPEGLDAYANPDGSVMINLPDDGVSVDVENNTINFDNYWANEFSPDNIEISPEGTVDVQFPEEGSEFNDDGSISLTAEGAQQMDMDQPEYYDNEYSDFNSDGSVTITPPEGVEVDGGIAQMDFDVANEQLEFPEEYQLNPDGTSTLGLPEGVEYQENINGLVFPEGEINLDEVPEGVDGHINPDGTTTVCLADGMSFDGETNSVTFDNYWTNEMTPDQVQIEPDGEVNIALPEGTEFYEDGSFTIPADQVDFVDYPTPDYIDDCDWTGHGAEGSYDCQPPEGFNIDQEAGEVTIPNEMIDEYVPVDDDISFNSDGTMNISVPEGTTYDTSTNSLTFPAGDVHLDEIPEQVQPTLNPDGTISVSLQDGMTFDGETGEVQMDNYWTNEFTPDAVEYSPEGNITINLPNDCEFNEDGSFSIPEDSVDFLVNPDPGYCAEGPEWVDSNPDGSVTLSSSDYFDANPEENSISMNTEYINDGFEDYIPEGVEFNADGTMTAQVPDGTLFDPDANALTFPEGTMHLDEIPEGVEAQLNANGSITVSLTEGMDYDPNTASVHFDNYWTNEMTPDCCEFEADGQCNVSMPHDAHYFEDGSVQIPEDSCDFVENAQPDYVDDGPEWVNDNPDGSVTITPPEGIEVNAEDGTFSMSAEMAMEELGGDIIPEEIQLNSDGTMSMAIPEEIQFDYNEGTNSFTLTETPEDFNINEVPEFFEASYNDAGNVVVSFPEGVSYNPDTNSLDFSNQLVNEIAPVPIEFTPEGEFVIHLPEDTQYFEEGFVLSSESAEFLDEPINDEPELQQQAS